MILSGRVIRGRTSAGSWWTAVWLSLRVNSSKFTVSKEKLCWSPWLSLSTPLILKKKKFQDIFSIKNNLKKCLLELQHSEYSV